MKKPLSILSISLLVLTIFITTQARAAEIQSLTAFLNAAEWSFATGDSSGPRFDERFYGPTTNEWDPSGAADSFGDVGFAFTSSLTDINDFNFGW